MTQPRKPLDLEPIKARIEIVRMVPPGPGESPTPMDMLARDADALVHEVEQLRLENGSTYCAYCGEAFALDAPAALEAVGAHIRTCANHPMRHVEAEVERLRAFIRELWERAAFLDSSLDQEFALDSDPHYVASDGGAYTTTDMRDLRNQMLALLGEE